MTRDKSSLSLLFVQGAWDSDPQRPREGGRLVVTRGTHVWHAHWSGKENMAQKSEIKKSENVYSMILQ